jgi:MFS superfamily sulfate permease-like transporter
MTVETELQDDRSLKHRLLKSMSQKIPIIEWLPQYKLAYLQDDLLAGLTLSAVILPQCLAYAQLATLPPVYGLYVAIIPSAVYTLFGITPYNSIGTCRFFC